MHPGLITLFVFLFICAIGGFIGYLVKLSYDKESRDREESDAAQRKRDDELKARQKADLDMLNSPEYWLAKLTEGQITVATAELHLKRVGQLNEPKPTSAPVRTKPTGGE